jgi:hypothetical protein
MMGDMRTTLYVVPASIVLLVLAPSASTADDFKLTCTLPFDPIATKPDPFLTCGNDGSGKNGAPLSAAKIRQANAKNNFCADMSNPVTVTFQILAQMQKQSPSKSALTRSRKALQHFFPLNGSKIGEGDAVRLLAFVKEAHISDCESGGEEVNCKTPAMASNDFHIPLMDPAEPNPRGQPDCTSVTAEMIPHYRPAAWSMIDLRTPVKNPVRVTGPLFYDDAHEPCKLVGGNWIGDAPQRISLWEIHPVYALDVCSSTDPKQCDVTSDDRAVWTPYAQWVVNNLDKVQATGHAQRSQCQQAAHH